MIAVLGIVAIFAVLSLLNLFTFVLPRTFLKKRQDFKNKERYQLAMSARWQFRPYAPDLAGRYNTYPFNQRGDRRVVFGVLAGVVENVPFTVFDFQLRKKITYRNAVVVSEDNAVYTLWTLKLPVALPPFRVATRGLRILFGRATEPQTQDPAFNKNFLVEEGDPGFVNEFVTPQLAHALRDNKIANLTVQGDELIYVLENSMTRTTAQEITDHLRRLNAVVRALPQEIMARYGAPAPQQLAPPSPPVGFPPPPPAQYGPPPGYAPPPAYGPPPGYGYPPPGPYAAPPQHYGPPQGYPPPPGYRPPGY